MKILTNLSVFDSNRNYDDDNYSIELSKEQDEVLVTLGIKDTYDTNYAVRFNGSFSVYLSTISDAIQRLDVKEGVDLVKFDNGLIGFIAYYNNITTYFEILQTSEGAFIDSDLIHKIAVWCVDYATQNTMSGQYYVDFDIIEREFDIPLENGMIELLTDEISCDYRLLENAYAWEDSFDLNCGWAYCPQYIHDDYEL